jgi:multiple sugar transport system ATP-binding protein
MGRAIVREPAAYLMDEPLSNLDAKLRVAMRAELARLHERLATTTVYVTHDQIEAMTLGQRVTVMRNGLVQQVGPPQELYRDPANLFVAAFIGSPSMNLVDATVDESHVEFAGFRLPLAPGRHPVRTGPVILGIRPDDFEAVAHADPGLPAVDVEVAVLEELGSENHVIFGIDAKAVEAEELREAHDDEDAQLLAEGGSLFTARVDPRTSPRVGTTVTLAVDPAGFHFFDPDTGQTLRAREGELAATA